MTTGGAFGPGRLVLVVGPSGAGKDTLIGLARDAFAGDSRVMFPRRLVSRPADAFEDHDTITEEAFLDGEARGLYPLAWQAHGLCYALPPSVVDAVQHGRAVIVNVSRAVIPLARRRFAQVAVVLVTAPPDILGRRLAARGRNENIEARLARAAPETIDVAPDLSIFNVGDPVESVAALNGLIGRLLSADQVMPARSLG
ncbi:phosphonate metabolism protein/1,5-bisphosphokinase (PRPP-forming) PhnN [Alsobacter sp. KACC 23698]|uniref:Ribose 1,5-bisphosphate phosphokinase PhnN n=1 Tax=Alsobacter sp. KACC 23698 TaxID=3149229 RepID=A0AAU7JK77_9HYPH